MKNNDTEPLAQQSNDEGEFSLRYFVDFFIMNWRWLLLSSSLCLLVAFVYIKRTAPIYQRSAVMLVKDDGNSSSNLPSSLNSFMQMNNMSVGSSVDNELYILRSYKLVQEVVRRLHLNNSYSIKSGLAHESLFGNKPFTLSVNDNLPISFSMTVVPINAKEAELRDIVLIDAEGGGET